jgi:hypothetical protein
MSSTMTLTCHRCRWSWGPVGVRPASPQGPSQAFLIYEACGQAQARTLAAGASPAALPCARCDTPGLRVLTRCPRCDSDGMSWGPFMP